MIKVDPYSDFSEAYVKEVLKQEFIDSTQIVYTHPEDISHQEKLREAVLIVLQYYMSEAEYLEWESEG